VHIGGISVGIFRHCVRINNFIVYNPRGFSRSILVELPEIYVDYDLGSLLKGKLHLSRLDVDLKELGLEKNKEGKMNVDSLKLVQRQEPKQPAKKPMEMQVDLFNLQVGRIVSKDYSGAGEPSIKVYGINLNKSYKNITSAEQLAALIISEPMKEAGIRGAKIYAVSALAGAAFFPVAVAATLTGKDYAQQDFSLGKDEMYRVCLAALRESGAVSREDRNIYLITGEVQGASITIKLQEKSSRNTQVSISARKYLLPKPEIASGILYKIQQKLK
jgi:hypothetical protein